MSTEQIKEGDFVEIYRNPVLLLHPIGKAEVKKILHSRNICDKDGCEIITCKVEFDEGHSYNYDVSRKTQS